MSSCENCGKNYSLLYRNFRVKLVSQHDGQVIIIKIISLIIFVGSFFDMI